MQSLPGMASDLVLSYQIIQNELAGRIKKADGAHVFIDHSAPFKVPTKLLADGLCLSGGGCVGCGLPFIIHRCAG